VRSGFWVGVALVAGIASGYYAYGERRAAVPRAPADRNVWSPAGDEPSREPFAGVAVPDGAYPDLRTALAAIPSPEPVAGDGEITVVVRTPEGHGLAGVRVRAGPRGGPAPDRRPERSREDRVRDLVRRERWKHASRREATTGPDGVAILRDAGDAAYWLSCRCPGYELRRKGRHADVRSGDRVEWVARPVGSLEVRVLMPDGSKADRARITAVRGGTQRGWKWTPDERVHELEPGRYRVHAVAGKHREYRSGETAVEVKAGVAPPVVTLGLEARRGVVGSVDASLVRANRGSLTVHLVPVRGGRPATMRDAEDGRKQRLSVDPAFRFLDVEPGVYDLLLGTDRYVAAAARARVEVADSVVVRDFVTPAPTPERFLTVEVYGPDGAPAHDVSFRVRVETPDTAHSSGAPFVVETGDGRYLLQHMWPIGETAGRARVTVSHPTFGNRGFGYGLPRSEPEIVRYRPLHRLDVRVDGLADSGYAGEVLAFLEAPRDPGARRRQFRWTGHNYVAADGTWGWRAEEGHYQVWLYAKEGLWPLAYADVTVRRGGTEVRLELPELHEVRVDVDEPVHEVWIRRTGDRLPRVEGALNPDDDLRTIRLRGLPAGTYRLRCNAGPPATFEVPRADPVRYRSR